MNKQNLSAYSLLELLVIMGIIGIILGIGFVAFYIMQESVTFNQGVNEVVDIIKDTKNLAKNNLLPIGTETEGLIYGYNLNFENNLINRSLCSRSPGSDSTTWTCDSASIDQLKSDDIYANLQYNLSENVSCYDIIFEALTGDMKVSKSPTSLEDINYAEDNCEILISFNSYNKKVLVNSIQNNYGIEE